MSKLWITLLIIFTLFSIPTFAQDQNDAESLCFDNGGFINADTGQCEVQITLNIKNNYPIEFMDMPFVMDQLDSVYDTELKNFIDSFSQDAGTYPTHGGWELDMDYTKAEYSDTVFSVIITEYMYTGGAHGQTINQTYTFDTDTETVLTLDDIFTDVDAGLAVVAPLAVDQLNEVVGDYTDSDWMARGTDPAVPDNYNAWYLTADGIHFYFGQYQVAAYAAGIQDIVIPWADLTDVLEPAFVPAS